MTTATVLPTGRLIIENREYRAAIGKRGVSARKVEADGATPAGLLPIRRVLYRADRLKIPRAAVPREPVGERDGWCDDPSDKDYNRLVALPHDGRHEDLWRRDNLYDVIGVLGWNDNPVERGRGSAIFLHVARADYAPTDGCVALALPDLLELLAGGLTALDVRQ